MGLGMLALLPLLSPLFVAIGVLFGMGREIVESEGANAEGVFTWYRRKFFPLAAGGIIIFLVTLVPLFIGVTFYVYIGEFSQLIQTILVILGVLWIALTSGALTMFLPAIIDGHSVLQALKISVKMSYRYFDRIFSVWLIFVGILILPFTPLLLMSPFVTTMPLVFIPAATVMVLWLIFDVLVVVPAVIISLSRVYLILSAVESTPSDDEHPGISFVGGI